MRILSLISELFSEKKCFSCRKLGHFFCPKCLDDIEFYKPYCYLCKKPSDQFYTHKDCIPHFPLRQVIVLTRYRHPGIKKLLRHAKYYGKYQWYKDLTKWWKNFFQDNVISKNSIFTPIPTPLMRRWKRGYNQTQKIAEYLSDIVDIPVNNRALKRWIYSKQQSHLSQSERKKNLEGSFHVIKNSLSKDTTIYLIDDIVSTWSTLLEATKILKKWWFTDIRAIVLASD